MKILRRSVIGLFLAVVLLSAGGRSAEASDFEAEDDYILPAGQTLDDDLFVTAGKIEIDGNVNGDVFATGGVVLINGDIIGNLFVGGGQVTIGSNVTGDVYATAGTLIFNGSADDVRVAGGEITINGEVRDEFMAGAGTVTFNGTSGGDAYIGTNELKFGESAKIAGKLSYTTPESLDSASRVAASSEYFEEQTYEAPSFSVGRLFSGWFVRTLFTVLGYVLLTWLMLRYRPGMLDRSNAILNNNWAKSAGWGIAYMFLAPIVVILLAIVTGLLFGFGGAVAIVALIFGISALVSLLSPVLIGYWLGNQFTDSGTTGILTAVAVLALVIALPLVGGIIGLVAFALAIGSLLLVLRQDNETIKAI